MGGARLRRGRDTLGPLAKLGGIPLRLAVRLLCLLAALLARAQVALGQESTQPQVGVIEAIEIKRVDVFSAEEARLYPFPFGLLNALHTTTRESFIRKQLIIKLGDPIDPARLLEAERSLRATEVFRSVSVQSRGQTVEVETRDAWSLIPRVNLARKGGDLAYTLGLEDANLLGRARKVELRYEKGFDRLTRSLSYQDPQFLAPHVRFQFRASDLSDGQTFEAGLARPFFAFETPNAGAFFYRNSEYDDINYAGGEESERYKKLERIFRAGGGKLIGLAGAVAQRLHFQVDWNDTLLSLDQNGTLEPADHRRFFFLWLGYEREVRDWIVRRQADRIDRDEDFNLGLSFRIDAGLGLPLAGASRALGLRAVASFGELIQSAAFSTFSASAETRFEEGGPRNTLLSVEARGYRITTPVTLAFRTALTAGFDLDVENQIELDALSGLRGYRLHAVAGTGRVVGNVEARVLLVSDILELISLAGAAFVDAGVSWGDPDGFNRLCDVGFGLRFGLTRASQNSLLKLDVARALRPDPLGRTGWLISFSSGPSF